MNSSIASFILYILHVTPKTQNHEHLYFSCYTPGQIFLSKHLVFLSSQTTQTGTVFYKISSGFVIALHIFLINILNKLRRDYGTQSLATVTLQFFIEVYPPRYLNRLNDRFLRFVINLIGYY